MHNFSSIVPLESALSHWHSQDIGWIVIALILYSLSWFCILQSGKTHNTFLCETACHQHTSAIQIDNSGLLSNWINMHHQKHQYFIPSVPCPDYKQHKRKQFQQQMKRLETKNCPTKDITFKRQKYFDDHCKCGWSPKQKGSHSYPMITSHVIVTMDFSSSLLFFPSGTYLLFEKFGICKVKSNT